MCSCKKHQTNFYSKAIEDFPEFTSSNHEGGWENSRQLNFSRMDVVLIWNMLYM